MNDDFMKSNHCEECGGRLFARESQALGICIECREGEDVHADLAASDAETRLDTVLADDNDTPAVVVAVRAVAGEAA